ncbi:substrate-binding domain-containing protein [Bythopirellula polymerisocia]|uniref:D-allose-binding periplasmic protein n=1 Tax=Bythopirellula polymerisocia TaxID=2528003 RepID=A0A5C6CVS0_9BACT|nr:substrate-binding domain-containing protein [Bythopirellula polymerisocia]TWU28680.1 D-allose-binding periplasmic protein precursor [Bythopirellula polymerisocia]
MIKNKWFWVSVCLAVVFAIFYNRRELVSQDTSKVPRIAFVLGGSEPFREQVASGAREAAKQYNADIEFIVPEEEASYQTELLARIDPTEFEGVAISPLEPQAQARTISALSTRTKVVTYDNEVPEAVFHRHVGTNNYVAGTLCGQLIKEALPDGGKIALFVGTNDRLNAQHRRQGLVDALKGTRRTPGADLDPIDQTIEAGNFTIVATYIDNMIPAVAKENAVSALKEHPDLDGMIGLYGYNGPMCLEVLDEAKKLGEIAVIAFDDQEPTLAGIEAGNIFATVAQNPNQYGYEAVRVLADMSRNKYAAGAGLYAVPSTLYIPCTAVKAENLSEYRSKLDKQRTESPE